MAESGTWRLGRGASQIQDHGSQYDDDSDEEQQRKNRRRRRRPLPPLDLLGASAPQQNYPNNAYGSSHSSAFTAPKARHQHIMADSYQTNSIPPSHQPPGLLNVTTSGGQMQSPVAVGVLPKRTASPTFHHQTPLSVVSSSSRTVTICCLQIQFEGGTGRRCTRRFLWMVIILMLVCIFSIVTVLLSYYSVDVSHSRYQMSFSAALFKKLSGLFNSGSSGNAWASSWNIPQSRADRINPTKVLDLFPEDLRLPSLDATHTFVQDATAWSHEHLEVPMHILYPYGSDMVTPRSIFPDAKSYFLLNVWYIPTVDDIVNMCDADCKSIAQNFALASLKDIEKEGFVTQEILAKYSSNALGVLPALLASIHAIGGTVLHIEDSPQEASLPCLKMLIRHQDDAGHHEDYVTVYCGNLDESNEVQRSTIRGMLRPMQPLTVLFRSANYALFPNVRPALDLASIAHFKALVLAMSSVVVQDDSGFPYSVLAKHMPDITMWGEYRGLGDPEVSGLSKVPGSVIKPLYQADLAAVPSAGPLPFRFGYRNVIRPSSSANKHLPEVAANSDADVFVKRSDFRGSHLIVARKKK